MLTTPFSKMPMKNKELQVRLCCWANPSLRQRLLVLIVSRETKSPQWYPDISIMDQFLYDSLRVPKTEKERLRLSRGAISDRKRKFTFDCRRLRFCPQLPPSRELFTNSERQLPYKYGVLSNLEWKESSWSWQSEQLPLGVSSPCRVLHPTTRLEQSAIGTLFSILFCARYWQSSATHWPPLNWFSWKTCKTILHLEILNGLETTWKPCQINWLTLQ